MADRNYDGTTIGQLAMWANNGDTIAMHKLATAYYEGIRVEENPQVALEYYMKAADGGNPDSILTLSNIYQEGVIVKQDSARAMAYLAKSAQLGNVAADIQLELAAFEKPEEVKPYADVVIHLLEEEANNGVSIVIPTLLAIYSNEKLVPKDLTKYAYWCQKYVDIGNYKYAFNLAKLYRMGVGVEKNQIKAFQLLKLAVKAGGTYAKLAKQHLEDMTWEMEHQDESLNNK